jgi:polyhydroxyalkanoate synthesis regulator phasin
MAKRSSPAQRLPETVREAVERTVQATVGSAQTTRERTQRSVDDIRRGAEESAKTVRKAIDAGRPATHEEVRELQKEIRALGRRLDKIEKQLPAKGSKSKSTRAKKKS